MEKKEFNTVVLPLQNKLFRIARSLMKSTEEAEDSVQETLLKLWTLRKDLEKYRSIEAFAITVTKNSCLDKLKSARHRYHSDETGREVGHFMQPDRVLEVSDEVERLRQAMATLPEQQRLILHLRDVEEQELEEIEVITGLSSSNVRVSLFRARKKMREILVKQDSYEYRYQ